MVIIGYEVLNKSVVSSGANHQINHANIIFLFLSLYFWWVTLAVALQTFQCKLGQINYLFINQTRSNSLRCRILMFNIMLLVNKALLVVLTICVELCYTGETRCPLFSTLCAAFGSNVGKSCQRVEKHFSSILTNFSLNIFNVFTMKRITLQMR